jgi:hypothetical protein
MSPRVCKQIEVVDDEVARILRRKTPAQRLQLAFEANEMARQIVEGSIRSWHGDWSDAQVRHEVARRMSRATG